MLTVTIDWISALLLASPFLLVVLFWIWKESDRIRNRWLRDKRDIDRLENLVCDARKALVGASVAIETRAIRELATAVEAFQEETENLPERPEDLDVPCDPSDLFKAKKLLEIRAVREQLEPIWDKKYYHLD